jgi:hypothetical protein
MATAQTTIRWLRLVLGLVPQWRSPLPSWSISTEFTRKVIGSNGEATLSPAPAVRLDTCLHYDHSGECIDQVMPVLLGEESRRRRC